MNTELQPSIRFDGIGRGTVLEAARRYVRAGMSVLPCRGKVPAISAWKYFTMNRPTLQTVDRWADAGLIENIGIICGQVSGGLVVVDLDGSDAVAAFRAKFSALTDTYTIASGSGQGEHLYFFVRDMITTTRVVGCKFGNVELRSDGCYVIAPPSIHPSGRAYRVSWDTAIARVNSLHDVQNWIKDLMREKHQGDMPRPANARPVENVSRWAAAALAGECTAVMHAARGGKNTSGRNDRLYLAALKLGSMVAGGYLSQRDVENALLHAAAALSADDGEEATRKTIASGLRTGIANKRVKPELQKDK